jgi:desulfoferrodoxin-like iron-binding protein
MNTYICKKCGYLAFNEVPEACPVCGAPKQAFSQDNNAIKKPTDPKNLNELEKKHIPLIQINRQCGLTDPSCIDASIKIGEVLHVSEAKHYIMYIDLYLDYAFIGRFYPVAEKLHPIVGIHLKVSAGKLIALENCNLHDRWIAEAQI